MRKITLFAALLILFLFSNLAIAQQADAMLGFGTMLAPGAQGCFLDANNNQFCPERGGLYTNIGADVIFHKRVGIGFDASWRSVGNFGGASGFGQPYRPIQFDFNGVYQPRFGKKVGADLFGGIGWQTTRFYSFQPTYNCYAYGQCYTSSNHFLVDLGAGIRYYVWGNVFVRPEAHYYHVLNNTDVFTSNNIVRVGASIGYTIGGPQ